MAHMNTIHQAAKGLNTQTLIPLNMWNFQKSVYQHWFFSLSALPLSIYVFTYQNQLYEHLLSLICHMFTSKITKCSIYYQMCQFDIVAYSKILAVWTNKWPIFMVKLYILCVKMCLNKLMVHKLKQIQLVLQVPIKSQVCICCHSDIDDHFPIQPAPINNPEENVMICCVGGSDQCFVLCFVF